MEGCGVSVVASVVGLSWVGSVLGGGGDNIVDVQVHAATGRNKTALLTRCISW